MLREPTVPLRSLPQLKAPRKLSEKAKELTEFQKVRL
jgi:hypothetical protein